LEHWLCWVSQKCNVAVTRSTKYPKGIPQKCWKMKWLENYFDDKKLSNRLNNNRKKFSAYCVFISECFISIFWGNSWFVTLFTRIFISLANQRKEREWWHLIILSLRLFPWNLFAVVLNPEVVKNRLFSLSLNCMKCFRENWRIGSRLKNPRKLKKNDDSIWWSRTEVYIQIVFLNILELSPFLSEMQNRK